MIDSHTDSTYFQNCNDICDILTENDSENIPNLQFENIILSLRENKIKGINNNLSNSNEKRETTKLVEQMKFVSGENKEIVENKFHYIRINDSQRLLSIITFDENMENSQIFTDSNNSPIFPFLKEFSNSGRIKNDCEDRISKYNENLFFSQEKNDFNDYIEPTASTQKNLDKFGGNISIVLDSHNEDLGKYIFIGKKKALNKFKNEKDFAIFTFGEYNNYSQKKLEESLNSNLKNGYKFEIHEVKYSKKYKKRIKTVHKRKENSDNIRKKIKSRFLKILKQKINEKLISAGCPLNKIFKFLPQSFVSDINKGSNMKILDLTFEEIISNNFYEREMKGPTLENYKHNNLVLKYLKENRNISQKSNFNTIKKMKYKDIFYEYLNSKEFKKEIDILKRAKESEFYIKKFIIKAYSLLDFFRN